MDCSALLKSEEARVELVLEPRGALEGLMGDLEDGARHIGAASQQVPSLPRAHLYGKPRDCTEGALTQG